MKFDVAIVGSGLAGLSVALHLAQTRTVAIISKRALLDGASNWAQGGIAAVLDSGDTHQKHIDDTLVAGGGLCDEAATRFIIEHGREAIEWLIEQGVPFTRDPTAELGFHLTREGGHSERRIIHAADATGHAVQVTLEQKVRAHPNITIFEQHCAIDVITSDKLSAKVAHPASSNPSQPHCYGLYVQDEKTGAVLTFELPGGIDAGKAFIDSLELFSHVANIGDVRSLAIHPASTTHSQGSPEEHAAIGVTPGLVRLAVGLEGIDDILADLDAGLRAAK